MQIITTVPGITSFNQFNWTRACLIKNILPSRYGIQIWKPSLRKTCILFPCPVRWIWTRNQHEQKFDRYSHFFFGMAVGKRRSAAAHNSRSRFRAASPPKVSPEDNKHTTTLSFSSESLSHTASERCLPQSYGGTSNRCPISILVGHGLNVVRVRCLEQGFSTL